ncbi:hypothetical protein [Streptomyces sp. NPDC057582]
MTLRGIHAECSAAVLGLENESDRELGRRYGQDAVSAWDAHS